MARRAEYRNEVKTRLDDRTYDGLRAFMVLHGIDHASVALERITKLFLFGSVGTLPPNLVAVSACQGMAGSTVNT